MPPRSHLRAGKALVLLVLLLPGPGRAQVASYPYLEDFETFGTGTPGTMQNGWSQGAGDDFDWTVQTGATPSTGTGPTGDHTSGTGIYLYMEASSPRVVGDEAILVSPTFDIIPLVYHAFPPQFFDVLFKLDT